MPGAGRKDASLYLLLRCLDYIEKNYQTNISLSELAEHKYFMNSSYLSRLFKNEVGADLFKISDGISDQKGSGAS